MKEYYLILNDEQKDSLAKEEVIGMKLTRETLIWHKRIDDWTILGNLVEFNRIGKPNPCF